MRHPLDTETEGGRVHRGSWLKDCRLVVSLVNEERRDHLAHAAVIAHAAALMGKSCSAQVPPDREFSEMGLGSLGALNLRMRVGATTGVYLPLKWLADSQTPTSVAGDLIAKLSATHLAAKNSGDRAVPMKQLSLRGGSRETGDATSVVLDSEIKEVGMLVRVSDFYGEDLIVRLHRFLAIVDGRGTSSISLGDSAEAESLLAEARDAI